MTKARPSLNLQGQALGRKGHGTRQRMMVAARGLLKQHSPVELTAVSIAKAAKTSSATFYLYFQDVKDLLLALSEEAEAEMAEVHKILEEPWDPDAFEIEHARRVVDAFGAVWNRHREVLRFRNLEADRGDERFEEIRLRTSLQIVNRFGEHILQAYAQTAPIKRRDAYSEASVLVAAMERLFAVDPGLVEKNYGQTAVSAALTRMIARTLTAHPPREVAKKR